MHHERQCRPAIGENDRDIGVRKQVVAHRELYAFRVLSGIGFDRIDTHVLMLVVRGRRREPGNDLIAVSGAVVAGGRGQKTGENEGNKRRDQFPWGGAQSANLGQEYRNYSPIDLDAAANLN